MAKRKDKTPPPPFEPTTVAEPLQTELIPAGAAAANLPDLRTLSLEAFVEVFIEQLEKRDDVVKLREDAAAQTAYAGALTIASAEAYVDAGARLRAVRTLWADADAARKAITAPIDRAKARVMDVFRVHLEDLEAAGKTIVARLAKWKDEQDRIAAEARRKADAEARAERERLEAEARAREAAARAEADAQRAAAELERNRGNAAAAERLESKANTIETRAAAKADTLIARASTVVAAPVAVNAPKVEGLGDRKVWKYEVLNKAKLNPIYLMPDDTKIGQQVRALKNAEDAVAVLGGPEAIKVWQETDYSARKGAK